MILNDLVRSTDSVIASAANLTVKTMASFQAGEISASEYTELMGNILDLDSVTKITDSMDRLNEIQHAFEMLKDIAGALSSLSGL